MQQPPPGRPNRPPGGVPPPGGRPGPGYPPPGWGQPAPPMQPPYAASVPPAPAGPPPALGPRPLKRKNRNALRFLAGSCVFSAWISLVLSLFTAFGLVMTGMGFAATSAAPGSTLSSTPLGGGSSPLGSGAGGEESGIPKLPGADLGGALTGGILARVVPPLCYGSAVFTLFTGVVTFLLFLGMGQGCYLLVDLEEQSFQMSEALGIIVARLGPGR